MLAKFSSFSIKPPTTSSCWWVLRVSRESLSFCTWVFVPCSTATTCSLFQKLSWMCSTNEVAPNQGFGKEECEQVKLDGAYFLKAFLTNFVKNSAAFVSNNCVVNLWLVPSRSLYFPLVAFNPIYCFQETWATCFTSKLWTMCCVIKGMSISSTDDNSRPPSCSFAMLA